MGTWSLKLHFFTISCIVVNLLCVLSHEVTVKGSNLMLCENKQVCVTDPRDCGPRPPSSIQKTLKMLCYYQMSSEAMTCAWSEESNRHTESHVSLIFSSVDEIFSCFALFNPAATFNITARIKNYMMQSDIWSQPHTVFISNAIQPSQPVLTVLGSTEDSVVVSWRGRTDGSCQLRYTDNHTLIWIQTPDSVPAHRDQTLTYTIKDLQPFTVYRAALACRTESGIWSHWSSEVTARTLDRVPSRPPEVCYRVDKTDSNGSIILHFMWKDLDRQDTGGRVVGYQVTYEPLKKNHLQEHNFTEVTAHLMVAEGNCSITVAAFNTAGCGPATRLFVDTDRQSVLPPTITNLWVSSDFSALKGLLVQWENPTALPSSPPVSHLAVQWHIESHPSTSRWTTVDSFANSTFIQDVDPNEPYLISVFPVYHQQCGPAQSLPASLQQGALVEVVRPEVVGVTKTTVTVSWAWVKKSEPTRVNRYSLLLKKGSVIQTLPLWPDQWQHTFLNLEPNTEYSLILMADNTSKNRITVRTAFDEVPVVSTATPLLLLAFAVFVICSLSRTVYKSYFFPPISSPRGSATGKWLMDPNHQKTAERNIMDIEDFQVTDILGEKSLIIVGPKIQPSPDEDLHEDTSPLSMSHLILKLSNLKLDSNKVSDAQAVAENQLFSLQSYHPVYTVNCHHPERAHCSEESEEPDATLLPQTHTNNSCFPQKKEADTVSGGSNQREAATEFCFCELLAKTNSHCVDQMSYEAEYVTSPSFLGKTDVETVTDCSYLICETDYIAGALVQNLQMKTEPTVR